MVKSFLISLLLSTAAVLPCIAQNGYQVITVTNGGAITGTVKWSGPQPHALSVPVTKDPQICDPQSHKRMDLERLVIGPDGGVANTVVYLKNISSGKAMDLPEARRFLDQKRCRYVPHILLVPASGDLQMQSSDATLHTIHMEGAATYNLPFPFQNHVISRNMQTPGIATLKCNGGHVWMNGVMMVVTHPYYSVTGENGKFELTDVPPGNYEIVAWHEGWHVSRNEDSFDVLTERKVERPLFTDPRTWQKNVSVTPHETAAVNFVLSEK
ncbi:MAG: carboxypeptidase-like regulatory domain-containing protein [Terriglobales bacterium]